MAARNSACRKPRGGGPKTAGGRARSSRNAFRHGLTTITLSDPAYSPKISEIAKSMCGDDQDPRLYQKALVVAECDVLIAQIGSYKQALIARLVDPHALPTRKWLAEWNKRMDFHDRQDAMHDKIMAVHPGPGAVKEDDKTKTFNRLLCEFSDRGERRNAWQAFIAALPDIMRAARYERRAWSRRRRAFFEFITLKSFSSYPPAAAGDF